MSDQATGTRQFSGTSPNSDIWHNMCQIRCQNDTTDRKLTTRLAVLSELATAQPQKSARSGYYSHLDQEKAERRET